jgi:hypothetical protein
MTNSIRPLDEQQREMWRQRFGSQMTESRCPSGSSDIIRIRKPSVISKAIKLVGRKAESLREAICENDSIVVPRG